MPSFEGVVGVGGGGGMITHTWELLLLHSKGRPLRLRSAAGEGLVACTSGSVGVSGSCIL